MNKSEQLPPIYLVSLQSLDFTSLINQGLDIARILPRILLH